MTHVLITGCNRGIGRALAEAALARGWRVTGTTRDATAPDGVEVIDCDVGEIELLESTFQDLAPLDILINNAGIYGPDTQAIGMDYLGFHNTLTVNTIAPLAVAEACLPALRQCSGSRILSVSSQMSFMGYRKSTRLAYRASKAALNKVMQGLASDLQPEGIPCVLIDPGWVRTDMGTDAAEEDPGDVAEGILQVAEKLTLADTGKFFRFSGEERDF